MWGKGGDAVVRLLWRWVLVVCTLQWLDKHVVEFLGGCMDNVTGCMCDYEVRGQCEVQHRYESWGSFHGSSKDGTRECAEWVCEGALLKDELVRKARNSVVEAGDVTMETTVVGDVVGTMRQVGRYRLYVALREEQMLHRGLMWWRLMNRIRRTDTHREEMAQAREYYAGMGATEICGVLMVPVLFTWWRAQGVLWGRTTADGARCARSEEADVQVEVQDG